MDGSGWILRDRRVLNSTDRLIGWHPLCGDGSAGNVNSLKYSRSYASRLGPDRVDGCAQRRGLSRLVSLGMQKKRKNGKERENRRDVWDTKVIREWYM